MISITFYTTSIHCLYSTFQDFKEYFKIQIFGKHKTTPLNPVNNKVYPYCLGLCLIQTNYKLKGGRNTTLDVCLFQTTDTTI